METSMSMYERLHNDAMTHLVEARGSMKKLMGCASDWSDWFDWSDWSAGTLLEIDFDHLEEACEEFSRCQFGLKLKEEHDGENEKD